MSIIRYSASIFSSRCTSLGHDIIIYRQASFLGNLFGGKKKDEEENKIEEVNKIKNEEDFLKEIEQEHREEEIRRARNKSRLNYSHRRMLKGQFPNIGVIMEESDVHRRPEFKAEMLAKYGRETGIDPSVAWPTKEKIEEEREFERVLYDGLTFKQMVSNAYEDSKREAEARATREKEYSEKLIAMRKELKAWRARVESKNKLAEADQLRRQKILAELKEEFGYAINPSDPQFAEKYAAKEKEYAKAAKEEKKRAKAERKEGFAEPAAGGDNTKEATKSK